MNPLDLTVSELSAALRRGELSSRQATTACLEHLARLDPRLHAFLHVAGEQALAEAARADRQLHQQRRAVEDGRRPLLGVPIAVKDVLVVEGMPCTAGSRILEGFIPPFTATAVRRLQEAGAIVVGKTNTDEFAMGSSTENSAFGPTRNPWALDRVPGGSSGGSAAAVAARIVPAALGSDTGGSIRQPAAFCGITGLKPTYGRVSRYGLIAYGSSLDCVGVLARTAEDIALLLALMAGRDPLDATSAELPFAPPEFTSARPALPLSGLRIGVPDEYFVAGMQAEVEAGVRAAVKTLADLGAQVLPVSLPHTDYALPAYYILAPAEASANLARYDGIRYGPRQAAGSLYEVFARTRGRRFGAEVERRIMLGTYALSRGYYEAYYAQAQKVRTLIRRDFEAAFEGVDLIAAPVAPTTAFPLGVHADDPLSMYLEDIYTLPANLAGVPGLAFPVGFDAQGLPVGMQLMAPPFREDLLLRAAHAYQQATDWHTRQPPLAGQISLEMDDSEQT
jgi:aspartyl-tRNA(Asn)/glutamyl-tRNA(Gln) amidotransferase subunit A